MFPPRKLSNHSGAELVELRTPENCRHRSVDSTDGSASCGLVSFLLDSNCEQTFAVSEAVCEACCKTFEPTRSDLNPVVASLVYAETRVRLQSSAYASDEASRLKSLGEFAERSLPLTLPEEDDLGPSELCQKHYTLTELAEMIPCGVHAGTIANWSVGVTTAPRRQATLDDCLDSLQQAGWDEFSLFVDGDVDLSDVAESVHRTVRRPAAGAWPNYHLSLLEMLLRFPNADAYMIVQDDTIFPNAPVREYLERTLWSTDSDGFIGEQVASLYCCGQDQDVVDGWAPFEERWKYGAVAIVFSPEAANAFVHSTEAIAHGFDSDDRRLAGIDDVIGRWLVSRGLHMLRPTPSLVEHIGHVSTLWQTARAVGVRAAGRSLLNPQSLGERHQ